MFAYARNMQLALGDKLRRAGLTAGAGVFLLIGLGFLLAALWTWLAHHLGWGALGASLAIGSGFVAIGLILLLLARNERHPLPTPDELKTEVEAQVSGMADAAIARVSGAADQVVERATGKASRLMGLAGQKARSATDDLAYRADRYADRAESQAYRTARQSEDALRGAARRDDQGADSRAPTATIAPLLGAFAVGITLASRLRAWRNRDKAHPQDWDPAEDWSDDPDDRR